MRKLVHVWMTLYCISIKYNNLHWISFKMEPLSLSFKILSKEVKLATGSQEQPEDSFSFAIILRCREERYSFPWIAPLYSWSILYICWVRCHQVPFFFFVFWVFDMTWPGIEHWSLRPLANTLPIYIYWSILHI